MGWSKLDSSFGWHIRGRGGRLVGTMVGGIVGDILGLPRFVLLGGTTNDERQN
jgi:hypothetical protein